MIVMSGESSIKEGIAIFVILAMMLLMALAVAIPLGSWLGILSEQVFVVYPKVLWIFLWVVIGFILGYFVVEALT